MKVSLHLSTLYTLDATLVLTGQIDAKSHVTDLSLMIGNLIDWAVGCCQVNIVSLLVVTVFCHMLCDVASICSVRS